jgi:hypothetical protein
MLTYPDRQRFEQIRARWEKAQADEYKPAYMVSWRDKPIPQQPIGMDSHENGASKFRRKLSYGLSLISNPLSQRKITPGRSQVEASSLVTESSATDVTTAAFTCHAPNLPVHKSSTLISLQDSAIFPSGQADTDNSPISADADVTPKPLPRSHTLGFLPLAVKTEPDTSATGGDGAVKLYPPIAMSRPEPESMPSRIPTPSPPLYEHRCSSPRRYLHHHASYHASQQIIHIAAAHAFAKSNNNNPAKYPQPLRSRTTPNLVKGPNARQTAGFMAPRQPGPKRLAVAHRLEKPSLQENIPMEKRTTNRRPQIQEGLLKRESLAVAGALYDKRSFGLGTPVMQGRRTSFTSPQIVNKRTSSHVAQNTPVTAKRLQREQQATSQPPNHLVMRPDLISKSSLPDNSTTTMSYAANTSKPTFLRSCTQVNLSRKTLGTPNSLGGVWRPSRALVAVNHEVSKLPRSHTFHNFGSQPEDAPPVPLLPVKYRNLSLSDVTRQLRMNLDTPAKPRHGRMASDTIPCQSISEENYEELSGHYGTRIPAQATKAPSHSETPSSSTFGLTAFPLLPNTPQPLIPGKPSPPSIITRSSHEIPCETSEDVGGQEMPQDADIGIFQVEDAMPLLYWAGRFQSRYDQWRTDAMRAELNIHSDQQGCSPLNECKLAQENRAVCYIFAQLHALCTSEQAENSLWVRKFSYVANLLLFN